MLTLPIDVTTAQVTPPRASGEVVLGGKLAEATIDEVIDLVRGARRPLLLAGSGVRGGGAPAKLRHVAEVLRCPVATTPKAKGVFPEDHALALGVFGLGGHTSAQRYIESGVDLVIALGTSLGDMATNGFSPALQAPALKAWKGETANVDAGRNAFLHRAKLNSAARSGSYTADMEKAAS